MNGHMDDHMNEKELAHWLRMRKWRRMILIGEMIYVVILMLSLVYNFGIFMHMLIIQGIVIFAYFVVGWIFDKGDKTVKFNKRDTLWESITSIKFNRLFFIRVFETIAFILTIGVAVSLCFQLGADLFQPEKFNSWHENIALYGEFFAILFLGIAAVDTVLTYKKQMRIFSVLAAILLLIIVAGRIEILVSVIWGLIGCAGTFTLSFQPKL